MVLQEGATPEYKINWVRVYQDETDERQKVGCSTPERPTRRFIEAHEKQYKTADDVSLGGLPTVSFVFANAMLTLSLAAPRYTLSKEFKLDEEPAIRKRSTNPQMRAAVPNEVDAVRVESVNVS